MDGAERKHLIDSNGKDEGSTKSKKEEILEMQEINVRPAVPVGREQTFHQAARYGDVNYMRFYLGKYSGDKDKINKCDENGVTALYYAVKYEHLDIVKMLLNDGADPNIGLEAPIYIAIKDFNTTNSALPKLWVEDAEGFTQCCLKPREELRTIPPIENEENIILLLLNHGADLKSSFKLNPVIYAASNGMLDVLAILLNCPKVNPEDTDKSKVTALHIACQTGKTRAAKMLMSAGASLRKRDKRFRNPLHYAAIGDGSEILKEIILDIEKHGSKIGDWKLEDILNDQTQEGDSILHFAIEKVDVDVCSFLTEKGADVNLSIPKNGNTPLHLAAIVGNLDICKILVAKKANVDGENKNLKTPLHKAAEFNHADIVSYLLSINCQIDTLDDNHQTPLFLAVHNGNQEAVELLLKNGADVTITDNHEMNVVGEAVENNLAGILQILLEYITKLPNGNKLINNQTFESRLSAMHIACEKGYMEIVQLLTEYGADTELTNSNGETPLSTACFYGHKRIVDLLLQKKNFLMNKGNEHQTLLNIAASNGHEEILSMLINIGRVVDKDSLIEPLIEASKNGFPKCASIILDKNVSANCSIDRKVGGKTNPLHVASYFGNLEVANILMAYGADPIFRNKKHGRNALANAITNSQKDVVLALLSRDDWKEMMENHTPHILATPMILLIQTMPDVAHIVLNKCMDMSKDSKEEDSPDFFIEMKYDFIDKLQEESAENDGNESCIEEDESDGELDEMNEDVRFQPEAMSYAENKEYHPLKLMCDYKRTDLLKHPLVKSLIHDKWNKFGRKVFYGRFLLYLIFLFFVTGFVLITPPLQPKTTTTTNGTKCTPVTAKVKRSALVLSFYFIGKYLVTVTTVLQMLLELIQLKFNGFKMYLRDPTNYLEVLMYILAFGFVHPPYDVLQDCTVQEDHISFGACTIFLAWINLLLFIQKIPMIGLYVVMFIHVTKTFLKFSIIFFLFMMAFSLSFYILLGAKYPLQFGEIARSFMKTFVMMIGEMDFDTLFNSSTSSTTVPLITWFFFFLFLIVMTILLMNVMVGLAVDDIKSVLEKSEFNRIVMMVRYILDVENVLTFKRKYFIKNKKIYPNRKSAWYNRLYTVTMREIKEVFNVPKIKSMEENMQRYRVEYEEMKRQIETKKLRTFGHRRNELRESRKSKSQDPKMNYQLMKAQIKSIEQATRNCNDEIRELNRQTKNLYEELKEQNENMQKENKRDSRYLKEMMENVLRQSTTDLYEVDEWSIH